MSLISVKSLSKSYGAVDLFSGLTFSVAKGARLALVGPNGVGKTTLLRILAGVDEASTGTVGRVRGLRVGYLPQEADFEMSGTLWEACLAVFADLIARQEELHRLEAQMADAAQAESILPRYGELQHEFERRGGYIYVTRIQQVLSGLGFSQADYSLSLDHLSGGQRTRAYLSRLLLSDPDLLLLDEPTNHLDVAAVEWLEGYLSQWGGAAVIVSHDRYFLDRACNAILEMHPGAFELYHGNYSAYLHQRQERADRRQEIFESGRGKLIKDLEYIKKNIAGQNVQQAKGKLRRLTRIVQAIEQVGMEAVLNTNWSQLDVETTTSPFSVEEAEKHVRALRSPVRTLPKLHLHLRTGKRSGDLVLRTKNLQVGYPGKILFRAPDIELRRQDCAALIGPNGAGKTTFLKTILGQIPPLAGEVNLGASLHVGYFAQAHEGLEPQRTLVQEIDSVMPGWLPGQIREYLGKYLFSGDDAFKKVEMLSGGERGRLALAKLALQDTNLLLLDEPTNHLDIPSQEVLEAVLDDYEGTILLVTHDRYLIDALATQIWEVEPDETRMIAFKGTYSELKAEREKETARPLTAPASPISGARPRKSDNSKGKTERIKTAQIQELENRIAALEARLGELGRALEDPPADPAEVTRLGQEYASLQMEMDETLGEWERIQG
jgi:ATP-binding cassette subfamily F protein 3